MPPAMTMDEIAKLRGKPVYGSDGDKIGSVEDIYYDEQTRSPHWLGIGSGFFGTKHILVPVEGAQRRDDGVLVPYPKDRVKDAPDIDADELTHEQEAELYRYYGVGARGAMADSTGGRTADGDSRTMTRSEEELRVGKREVDAGHVRLRKWVETQPVEADVELRRETARIDREPINQPVSGAEIGEQEVEVRLTAEQAVVDKEVVAKERVSLATETTSEVQTISDEVRKEHIEAEGVDERGGRR